MKTETKTGLITYRKNALDLFLSIECSCVYMCRKNYISSENNIYVVQIIHVNLQYLTWMYLNVTIELSTAYWFFQCKDAE